MRVVDVEAVEEVEEEREFEGGVTGTHSDKQLRVKKVASNSLSHIHQSYQLLILRETIES